MKTTIIIATFIILAGCAEIFAPYTTEAMCAKKGGAWVEMSTGHYSGATMPGCKP